MGSADLKMARPLTLQPSGLTLPNRLVKAAMAEAMAEPSGLPGDRMIATDGPYGAWSTGGWGMVLTGNVQVDERHLGQPRDLTLRTPESGADPEAMRSAWRRWAATCNGPRMGPQTPVVVQLNHPGKQSPAGAGTRGYWAPSISASAIPLNLGDGWAAQAIRAMVFGTPREMTKQDIAEVTAKFAAAAKLAADSGFAGVEIHAAHGYLLAQFMSPRSNVRGDEYGGSAANRARFVVDVVRACREATSHVRGFCVGIKLNSVDHQSASELEGAVEQLKLIRDAGVDFIEISGGTYEDPTMSLGVNKKEEDESKKSASTRAREAFFLEFAQAVRSSVPDVPLMVTGGFRTKLGIEAALESGACDLIGVGRPAVLDPKVPLKLMDGAVAKEGNVELYARKIEAAGIMKWLGIKFAGAGAETSWYSSQIRAIGAALLGAS